MPHSKPCMSLNVGKNSGMKVLLIENWLAGALHNLHTAGSKVTIDGNRVISRDHVFEDFAFTGIVVIAINSKVLAVVAVVLLHHFVV